MNKKLQNMTDKDIDYSDIAKTDEDFWKNAKLVLPEKKAISIRLDSDVLEWLKADGKGYQSRINKILRFYMEHQQ